MKLNKADLEINVSHCSCPLCRQILYVIVPKEDELLWICLKCRFIFNSEQIGG